MKFGTVRLGGRELDSAGPPFIVAEVSGNHNGSLDRARRIIDAAIDAGADAIKLQTYTADTLTLDLDTPQFRVSAAESPWSGRTLHELYREAHTPWEWHADLFDHCRRRGKPCFSSPFDASAVAFLEGLGCPAYKIASFEIVDLELVATAAATGKPLILSTGLATLEEIADALNAARDAGCRHLALLKCTSSYPADPADSHLRTIAHLREKFGCEVGLSDHTAGIGAAVAAVAFGAAIIEKHVTLSRADGGVDAAFSLEPAELALLRIESDRAWRALGGIVEGPTSAEAASRIFRRSLYVVEDLAAGTVLTRDNVRSIRPGHGLAPKHRAAVLGRTLKQAVRRGTPLSWDLLEARRDEPSSPLRAEITAPGDIAEFMAGLDAAAPAPRIAESEKLWRRGEELIPAGTQTLSKGPTQFVRGFAPKYLVRGEGCHVWDADGNRYIDYPMGLGAVTLGHAHPEVVAAVRRQLAQGTAHSLMQPLEVDVAERICAMVPCAEQVRFGKNGSDATSACIRAARALTGREHVARCGYHGWHDWALDQSHGIRARGVPAASGALTHAFAFNDAGSLRSVLAEYACAAVILEPVSDTPPRAGFLEEVREAAHRAGALLIFDEVITGFRYARGGAQEYFGVNPDLACMGKGVANGLPLSIVCGRRDAMKIFEEVFFSLTFGGESAALAAAMATLDVMEREDYWAHAWRIGTRLQEGYGDLAARFRLDHVVSCAGMAPWTIVQFRDAHDWSSLQYKTLFQQEMIRRGILFSGSQFLSLAHTDAVIDATLEACREAFRVLRFAVDHQCLDRLLRGRVNEPVFRRT